ncbi:MAG: pyridoxine 5'-phosphate synthase [Dissulfurispiraceae bacterium]|jgi:pyridoxine 5-phosphate synthase|nr:pyridoxine 5'-phosphate synthase [Dissulfurispiraceae bacterium]
MILGVNIDHVATIREARRGVEPDPVMAAPLAILGGADGITIHLREDRRHINDRDLRIMREIVTCELNLEMAATDEMIRIAIKTKPELVTLVPEKREELTTEGGLDMKSQSQNLKKAVVRLHRAGIPVSLFINPDRNDIALAHATGADMVEIHTGLYSNTKGDKQTGELARFIDSVGTANNHDLMVNAGHGLNYFNVSSIASVPDIRGLYIGHSIISRAVFIGLEKAVAEMKGLINRAIFSSL